MEDLQIEVIVEYDVGKDSFIVFNFNQIPQIIANFILSGKMIIPDSTTEFIPMQLYYANDKEGMLDLLSRIGQYIMLLDENKLNELILVAYLQEIKEFINNLNLKNNDITKKLKK